MSLGTHAQQLTPGHTCATLDSRVSFQSFHAHLAPGWLCLLSLAVDLTNSLFLFLSVLLWVTWLSVREM